MTSEVTISLPPAPLPNGETQYKILGTPRSFVGGSKDVYGATNPAHPGGMHLKLVKYIEDTLVKAGAKYSPDIQSKTLIAGWGGMTWPVDGRCEWEKNPDGSRKTEHNKKFTFVTKWKGTVKDLQTCHVAKDVPIKEASVFDAIYAKDPSGLQRPRAGGAFGNTTKENAKKFYTDLGATKFTVLSSFLDSQGVAHGASWISGHPKMRSAHYQVDVGSGKAKSAVLLKNGTTKDHGRIDWNSPDLADELLALIKNANFKAAEDRMRHFAREMLKDFASAKLIHELGTKPTAAFGLTGKWRVGEDPLSLKHAVFNLFKRVVKETFIGHVSNCDDMVFEVTGNDEARYGAESFAKIPGLFQQARDSGIKYFVSLESGNGSTQIAVIDLSPDATPTAPIPNNVSTPRSRRLMTRLRELSN